jgi:hypothetical protein
MYVGCTNNESMNDSHSNAALTKGVWSPRALVWFALCSGAFSASVMLAINYGRYGQRKKRLFVIVLTIVAFIAFCLLDYIDPHGRNLRIIILSVATSWIFYVRQIAMFKEWKTSGGKTASVLSGIGVSICCLMVFSAMYVVIGRIAPDLMARLFR